MKDSNCDAYVKSMSEILSRKLSQLLIVADRVGKTLETLSSQPRSFLSRNRSRLFTSPTYTRTHVYSVHSLGVHPTKYFIPVNVASAAYVSRGSMALDVRDAASSLKQSN